MTAARDHIAPDAGTLAALEWSRLATDARAEARARGPLPPLAPLPASDPFDATSPADLASFARAAEARARWEREDDGRAELEDLIADLRDLGLTPSLERRLRELVDDVRARRGAA